MREFGFQDPRLLDLKSDYFYEYWIGEPLDSKDFWETVFKKLQEKLKGYLSGKWRKLPRRDLLELQVWKHFRDRLKQLKNKALKDGDKEEFERIKELLLKDEPDEVEAAAIHAAGFTL